MPSKLEAERTRSFCGRLAESRHVDPPPRPGATLWSIAAGPLVNVVLYPILTLLIMQGRSLGWASTSPDLYRLIIMVRRIDFWLFAFNILPIYPLDGGQIFRSLLWFVMGRARSLMVAKAVVGLIGVAGFIGLALWQQDVWLGAIAVFMLMNCWSGLQHARALLRFAKVPRRDGLACPTCQAAPPVGDYWTCGKCGQPFDMFQSHGVCPHCSTQFRQDQMPGLWKTQSHERLDGRLARAFEILGVVPS